MMNNKYILKMYEIYIKLLYKFHKSSIMVHKYKIKLFIRFLKEHKVYNKFMRNALSLNGFEYRKQYCEGRTLNEHINYELKHNNGKDIFNYSFQWDKTDEGDDFWYDIYLKWDKLIDWVEISNN